VSYNTVAPNIKYLIAFVAPITVQHLAPFRDITETYKLLLLTTITQFCDSSNKICCHM